MATVWRSRSSVFASCHWFVSCPGVAAAELSIKPTGPVYKIILYMHAPTLGPSGGTVGSDGGGGTKTLQLELPVATHPLVKNKIHILYVSEIRTSTVCM